MIDVVAAVLLQEGKYFIALRPDDKHHGGLWEFPGGKVLPGESFEAAITRELKEELELTVKPPVEKLRSIVDGNLTIHFLQVSAIGNPVLREHQKFLSCSISELRELPLCPIDERFVKEHLPDPVPPWKFRTGKDQSVSSMSNPSISGPPTTAHCDIKGNITRNGKIYHMPGQKYYTRTRITKSRGERWFCSETEARSAGWRRAKV